RSVRLKADTTYIGRLAPNIGGSLVGSHANKSRVPQDVIARPLDERDLDDQAWFDPLKFAHVVGRDAGSPVASPDAVWQIGERTGVDLEALQAMSKFGAQMRREAVANLRGEHQTPPVVVAHDQRFDRWSARLVSADH